MDTVHQLLDYVDCLKTSEDQTEPGLPQFFMSHHHHTKHRGGLTTPSPAEGLQPHLQSCGAAQMLLHGSPTRTGWKIPTSTSKQGLPVACWLLPQPCHSWGFHPIPTFTEPSMDRWRWVHWLAWEGQVSPCQVTQHLGSLQSGETILSWLSAPFSARSLSCPQGFQGPHTENRHTQDLSSSILI